MTEQRVDRRCLASRGDDVLIVGAACLASSRGARSQNSASDTSHAIIDSSWWALDSDSDPDSDSDLGHGDGDGHGDGF